MVILPPELESQVAEKARVLGISTEAYVERVLREAAVETPRDNVPLPKWPGCTLGSLHRKDLYDEVR